MTTERGRTANDAFKRRAGRAFPVALALSTGIHAAAVGLPSFEIEAWTKDAPRSLQIIDPVELQPLAAEAPLPPEIVPPAVPQLPPIFGVVEAVLDVVELEVAQFPVFDLPALPPSVIKEDEFKHYQSFMPTMVGPELQNRSKVQREFERRIPSSIRYGGREGRVRLLLWIDEEGAVQKYELRQSKGSRSFARTVEDLVALLSFRPTLWHGRPIASVVELPFSFDVR